VTLPCAESGDKVRPEGSVPLATWPGRSQLPPRPGPRCQGRAWVLCGRVEMPSHCTLHTSVEDDLCLRSKRGTGTPVPELAGDPRARGTRTPIPERPMAYLPKHMTAFRPSNRPKRQPEFPSGSGGGWGTSGASIQKLVLHVMGRQIGAPGTLPSVTLSVRRRDCGQARGGLSGAPECGRAGVAVGCYSCTSTLTLIRQAVRAASTHSTLSLKIRSAS
jgi:hypothetical protein